MALGVGATGGETFAALDKEKAAGGLTTAWAICVAKPLEL